MTKWNNSRIAEQNAEAQNDRAQHRQYRAVQNSTAQNREQYSIEYKIVQTEQCSTEQQSREQYRAGRAMQAIEVNIKVRVRIN